MKRKNFLSNLLDTMRIYEIEKYDFLCSHIQIEGINYYLTINHTLNDLDTFLKSLNIETFFDAYKIDGIIWLKNGNYLKLVIQERMNATTEEITEYFDFQYFIIPEIPNRLKY